MFLWLNGPLYTQYLLYVALLTIVICAGSVLWSRWIHRLRHRRTGLVIEVQTRLLKANLALASYVAEVTVPADVLTEFNIRRNRVLNLLENIQDVVLRAKEGEKKDLPVLVWEEFNLRDNLWALRRFDKDALHTFRVDVSALIHEWMEDVRTRAMKACAEVEERLFNDELRYRTFAQEFNVLFIHTSLIRGKVQKEQVLVCTFPDRLPTRDQVQAHTELIQKVAELKKMVEETVSSTAHTSSTAPPTDIKPRWLYN